MTYKFTASEINAIIDALDHYANYFDQLAKSEHSDDYDTANGLKTKAAYMRKIINKIKTA